MRLSLVSLWVVTAILSLPIATSAERSGSFLLDARLAAQMPPKADWALVVKDLVTGRETASAGNALHDPLVPASLVKLFTAGAVLDHDERHGMLRMRTVVLFDGAIHEGTLDGNLYLVGDGNALLSTDDLRKVARTLAATGVRLVSGSIVADDTIFDTRGLERSRKGAGYAPAGALGLDLHTVALTVVPTEPGKPPKVTVEPPNDAVRFAVAARTASIESSSIKVDRLDDTAYRVSGNIAAGAKPVKQRFPLQEPAHYAAGVLKTALRQAGVEVRGKVKEGKAPATAKTLVKIDGPDPRKLLQNMDINSLNVVADNLLLFLGAQTFGTPGTREKGLKTVNDFLSTLGLPAGEVAIADGSGLHRENRVTARYMAEYLVKVAQKGWFGSFRDTLPRIGLDGTLRGMRYKNERFRVKSGRLEDAFALAGYGVDGNGREFAFSYIVNVPDGAVMDLERTGAEVMRYLGTEVLQ
ncbi:MAG TPA: D-alanyl-D-alanine carboxypeptidase/D-alanyl-D-alanine-endopeptidase [Geobacteraceae bacterium]